MSVFLSLDQRMRDKQITNEWLAARSGMAMATVARARLGKPIQRFTFETLFSTITNAPTQKYKKRGPKKGDKV